MPPAPDHFARCTEINRQGPALIRDLKAHRPFSPKEVEKEIEEGKTILDTRPYLLFAAAHIPGAYSISHHGNLPTFAGWIMPPDDELGSGRIDPRIDHGHALRRYRL